MVPAVKNETPEQGGTTLSDLPPRRRPIAVTAAVVVVAVAALIAGRELSAFRGQGPPALAPTASATASARLTLPLPVPQPITRTSLAAQVAWVQTIAPASPSVTYLGIDAGGHIVGRIEVTLADGGGRLFRSADGAAIAVVGMDRVRTFSALDGSSQRTVVRQPGGTLIDAAFSPDGRWLAIIGAKAAIELIDLATGVTQATPLGFDPHAATPGLNGAITGPVWSNVVFAPDSKRLYTLVDWGGPLRLTTFDVTPSGIVQTAAVVSGQAGTTLPTCAGPALAPRVLPDGRTMLAFCHYDGDIWFIDLATLTVTGEIASGQRNPFELSPIFTPDGHLLYLRADTTMRVLDVASRRVAGPVAIPRKPEEPGPFSWLFPQAAAGYVASTIPLSPDGTKMYVSGAGGMTVLRVPDLKPIATLAPGLALGEVWISGDGKTVFATDAGHGLYVVPESGGPPITVMLPGQTGGYFVASEHG